MHHCTICCRRRCVCMPCLSLLLVCTSSDQSISCTSRSTHDAEQTVMRRLCYDFPSVTFGDDTCAYCCTAAVALDIQGRIRHPAWSISVHPQQTVLIYAASGQHAHMLHGGGALYLCTHTIHVSVHSISAHPVHVPSTRRQASRGVVVCLACLL